MKQRIVLILVAMIGGMFLIAPSASATHPEKCYDTIEVPAYDEVVTPESQVKIIDVPAQEAVPAQDAVYEILYQFKHKHGQIKWKSDPNWNAESNPNSTGWHKTGVTKNGDLITPAVPDKDAVEEVSHMETVPAVIVHHEATTEQVEVPCEPVATVRTRTQERQVVGLPDCETGTITISHQERTRVITITDGVKDKGPWSEWVEVSSEQVEATDCPVIEEPPVDEPVVDEPTVDEPQAITPAIDQPITSVAVDRQLPDTGGVSVVILGAAVVAILAGAVLLLRRRRNL